MAKYKEIKDTIKANRNKFSKDKKIKEFEQSLRNFYSLVERGMLRPRGYNIESIGNQSNNNVSRFVFNQIQTKVL